MGKDELFFLFVAAGAGLLPGALIGILLLASILSLAIVVLLALLLTLLWVVAHADSSFIDDGLVAAPT